MMPRRYRVPTSILWVNDGWAEVWSACARSALAHFQCSGYAVDKSNLQVMLDRWHFADQVEVI